ncbi:putative F-box protein At3g10790 [Silene latifolia]|uniref:putative F-box protein At3g10790 n=1 Tax=Silene latifolia TaxID=37657 RepID=UPI003D77E531
MWDNLPTEISTNILHRLPVKTLIKCTILSKSFLSLITSHPFISDHITQHNNSHLLLRYFTHDKQELYHFDPDDDTFSGFQTQGLVVPFLNYPEMCFTVAGCINGVLCLVNDFQIEGTLIILWNPSIRKFVHLPRPILVFDICGPYQSVCGFGFDPVSDDYKVVRVVELDNGQKASSEAQVEVYSLKSGCWRVIGGCPCYSIKHYDSGYTPRFINGSVYWLGTPYAFPNCETVLLKFDMSSESFETIQLSGVLKLSELRFTRNLYLQEIKGVLTLIKSNYKIANKTCSAWILKEDGVVKSWTKIFDFDIAKLRPHGRHGRPLAFSFRKNGEVIMVKSGLDGDSREESGVVSIDPVTQSGTTVRVINADRHLFYLCVGPPSLITIWRGNFLEIVYYGVLGPNRHQVFNFFENLNVIKLSNLCFYSIFKILLGMSA